MSGPEAPEGVSLHLSDGTKVPCRCDYVGRDADGLAVWVAEPIEPRVFEARPVGLAVDVMPGETALHVGLIACHIH